MIVKEIIKREFHFDNNIERNNHIEIMKTEGYKIVSTGAEDDFFFTCEKVIKK